MYFVNLTIFQKVVHTTAYDMTHSPVMFNTILLIHRCNVSQTAAMLQEQLANKTIMILNIDLHKFESQHSHSFRIQKLFKPLLSK